MNFIVQRLKKTFHGDFQIAQRYYGLVSALNDINLTEKEIELMSFIALSGKEKFDRMEFCSSHNTTRATVNNMVAKLMKKNVLVKSKNAVMVNPLISLDFSKDVQLEIKLVHEEK
jgi:DNA-binding MarR family transcriptional regulator